jgi:hypothetical protein
LLTFALQRLEIRHRLLTACRATAICRAFAMLYPDLIEHEQPDRGGQVALLAVLCPIKGDEAGQH